MKQCEEELLRKKNSIIENLQSTEKSLLANVDRNPRLWDRECFEFKVNSQATVVLRADLTAQDRTEQKQIDAKKNADRPVKPPSITEASQRRRDRSSNRQTSKEKTKLNEYFNLEGPPKKISKRSDEKI